MSGPNKDDYAAGLDAQYDVETEHRMTVQLGHSKWKVRRGTKKGQQTGKPEVRERKQAWEPPRKLEQFAFKCAMEAPSNCRQSTDGDDISLRLLEESICCVTVSSWRIADIGRTLVPVHCKPWVYYG